VVAVLMKNSTAFLELVFATSHIGAVFLPIKYRLSADEIGYIVIVRISDARLLIADEELAAIAAGNAPLVPLDEAAQASATKLAPEAEPALMHPRRPKGEDGVTQFFHCSVEMGKVILTTQMVKSMSLRQHTGAGYGPCWLFIALCLCWAASRFWPTIRARIRATSWRKSPIRGMFPS
jgi:acyl-CoA synthetase (AMP-forming)/AMP-acid ligase II